LLHITQIQQLQSGSPVFKPMGAPWLTRALADYESIVFGAPRTF